MPLAEDFLDLWRRIGADENKGPYFFSLIRQHYSEPERFYHTLEHITHCLEELKSVRHLCDDPDAIEMSLWFHDLIYTTHPKNKDDLSNEELSAKVAASWLHQAGVDSSFRVKVIRLIMLTNHRHEPKTKDEAFMLDIDLAILGQPEDVYQAYVLKVRQEYEQYTWAQFAIGRIAFMKTGFLDRPIIYHSTYFRDKYEAQARINIANEIATLRKNFPQ